QASGEGASLAAPRSYPAMQSWTRQFNAERSAPSRSRERDTRHQKQDEDYPAERRFVELAVKHPAEPSPDCQDRQPEEEQAHGLDGYDPDAAESHDDHEKARNAGRLKHGPLLIARPPAHARPDHRDDAGEPGRASDHAIENAYGPVRHAACLLHLRQLRPSQIVEAEKDEQQAYADPQMDRRGPTQSRDAKRDSQRAAQDERHEPVRIKQMTQLPDRVSLHQERIGGDERGGLRRRKSIKPDRGGDHAEGKT